MRCAPSNLSIHWPALLLAIALQSSPVHALPTATFATEPAAPGDRPATITTLTPSGEELLQAYRDALAALPSPHTYQYRQQIAVTGSTAARNTADVLHRQDGTWQAWLYEGNRARLLDSINLQLVRQTDVAHLYNTYISNPDALAVEEIWSFNADSGAYTVDRIETVQLGDRWVHHLVLTPNEGGWLQHLWLDRDRHLPVRAQLAPSTRWGDSTVTIDFGPVDRYWLPQAIYVELDYRFLSFPGLLQVRSFSGALNIEHQYQDYTFLDETNDLPSFSANRPSASGQLAAIAGAIPQTTESAAGADALGNPSSDNLQLDASLSDRQTQTAIATRIDDYNATQPGFRNALQQFDTISQLHLGDSIIPIYLVRFGVEGSLTPVDRNRPNASDIDPAHRFDRGIEPSFRFFGTGE